MEQNGKVKQCFVQLEMLNIKDYDSDSSIDLPEPTYLHPTKKKTKKKKSSEELLLEFRSLGENIEIDTVQNNDMEEKLRNLDIINDQETVEESSTPPLLNEEKPFHIFRVKDSLQFFNKHDATLNDCGYQKNVEFTSFERELMSGKNVELEHVISSFLFSSNIYCISDYKSFVTYLLRNLSVYEDVATINACYNVQKLLLTNHTEAKSLTFSSADIFMLLFNYGVDVDSFKFLQQWSDVINHLEAPRVQSKGNASAIPKQWTLNMRKIFKAVINLLSNCTFKSTDLYKITVFFLWISLDASLLQENLHSIIKECISVCLKCITKEKWNKTLCDIVQIVISMEFSSEREKWKNIAHITESIPVDLQRGIQLQKLISFFALSTICNKNIPSEVTEDCLEYNLNELQNLLQKLKELEINLMSSATKFVDVCVRHLNTTKEECQELLGILHHYANNLDEGADGAKKHFSTLHYKLSLSVGNQLKMYQDGDKVLSKSKAPKCVKREASSKIEQFGFVKRNRHKLHSLPFREKKRWFRNKPMSLMPSCYPKFSKAGVSKNVSNRFQCKCYQSIRQFHEIDGGAPINFEDQYDNFGKHVASQLRELPERCFITLQSKIQSMITTERLSYLD